MIFKSRLITLSITILTFIRILSKTARTASIAPTMLLNSWIKTFIKYSTGAKASDEMFAKIVVTQFVKFDPANSNAVIFAGLFIKPANGITTGEHFWLFQSATIG